MVAMTATARSALARMMSDRCRITEPEAAAEGTLNPSTFEVTFPDAVELYDGPCMVSRGSSSRADDSAVEDARYFEWIVKLPRGEAPGVRVGCLVTIVETVEPELVNAQLEVVQVIATTRNLLRRLVTRRIVSYPSTGGEAA